MPSKLRPFSWRPFGWNNLRAFFAGSMLDREQAEVEALYARVLAAYSTSPYANKQTFTDFIIDIVTEAANEAEVTLPRPLQEGLWEMVARLLHEDPIIFGMPERLSLQHVILEAGIDYQQLLMRKEQFLQNPAHYESLWRKTTTALIWGLLRALPGSAFSQSREALFSIPLIDLCDHVPLVVERIMATMYDDDIVQARLFEPIRIRFEHNLAATLGVTPEQALRSGRMAPLPTEWNGDAREIVAAFLADTPFARLFGVELGFEIPEAQRLEHTVIVAGSGHGKTQTLEALICNDLAEEDPPGIVVIDSKGDMVRRLSKHYLFHPEHGRLKDRLIIIDPRDGPSLNMFDVNLSRLESYDAAHREQVINGVVSSLEYFMASLLGADLTSKQQVVFKPLAFLMAHIPGATLHTFMEAMDDLSPYEEIIAKLPPAARTFLLKEFRGPSYRETRTEVKRRLYQIMLESPTFERMFTAPKNSIDLADALNRGKIILVSTERNFLANASPIFGRYFISQCISAALQRAAIPETDRKPAFIYIDEAASYFDRKIDELLSTLRSYKLGAVLAFQYLGQASADLQSSISANTSIKLVGGTTERDARAMASDMRTTTEFMLAQHKDTASPPRFTRFACYVRNHTPHAVSLVLPLGVLDSIPQINDSAYARLRDMNRGRYAHLLPAPIVEPRQAGAEPSKAEVNRRQEGSLPRSDDDTLTRPTEDY